MAILRQHDARIGCLALPLAALGGFVVVALGAAAIGLDASASTVAALIGAAAGALVAALVVARTSRRS